MSAASPRKSKPDDKQRPLKDETGLDLHHKKSYFCSPVKIPVSLNYAHNRFWFHFIFFVYHQSAG